MESLTSLDTDPVHIVFAGGGTLGHLFPGLAVAEQLRQRWPQARITFVGSGKPLERQQVADAGLPYHALRCRPLPRRLREACSFIVENLAGYLAARRFLVEQRADAVVGLGGYASVAIGTAACRQKVPLILLEQNAVAGRATRWLARRAALVCLALEQARVGLRGGCPVQVTGNPIRAAFAVHTRRGDATGATGCLSASAVSSTGGQAARGTPDPRDDESPVVRQVVVLGGSSGARSLNKTVPLALDKLREKLGGWQIVHQAGATDLEATRQLYQQLALPATVVDFIAAMPEALSASTLAICRAGGTTLAELAALGVPAVLVPYPHAADNHQRRNAEVFADAGAAVIVDEGGSPDRLDDRLAEAISPLLDDRQTRQQMSSAMRRLARPDAARQVADAIRSLFAERGGNIGPVDSC